MVIALPVLLKFAWVPLLILALVLYKMILRVFFGMVIIAKDQVG